MVAGASSPTKRCGGISKCREKVSPHSTQRGSGRASRRNAGLGTEGESGKARGSKLMGFGVLAKADEQA